MATRVGDWYAFSRDRFYRTITMCDVMSWDGCDNGPRGNRSILSSVALSAVAPFGGPIAVVRGTLGDMEGEVAIEVYSGSGELLAGIVLRTGDVGPVVSLSWTKEEDLCVVTGRQLCLLYSLCYRTHTQSSGLPSFSTAATPILDPVSCFSLLSGREIAGAAAAPPARPGHTTASLVIADNDGVITTDCQRTLRGVLHGERRSLSAMQPVVLPLSGGPLPVAEAGGVQQVRHHPQTAETAREVVTSMCFVAPDRHDGGVMIVLWATATLSPDGPEEDAQHSPRDPPHGGCCGPYQVHAAYWEELMPAVDAVLDVDGADLGVDTDADEDADDMDSSLSDVDADSGDDKGDAAAAKRRRKKKKKKKQKKMRKRREMRRRKLLELQAARAHLALEAPAGKVASATVRGCVVALETCPYNPSRVAAYTSAGLLYIFSSDLSTMLFALDTQVTTFSSAPGEFSHQPPRNAGGKGYEELRKLVWCGRDSVVLHLCHLEAGADLDGGPAAEHYTVLLPLGHDVTVRGERLDWRYDGSEGLLVASEADGARVVTDCGNYMVEEVRPVLASLCRLQPPFHAAQDCVTAFQKYAKGRREGFVEVRAILAAHRDDAEAIFYGLLEAAVFEREEEQQLLFLSTAGFVLDTTACAADGPDRISDVVARLRIMRALQIAGTPSAPEVDGGRVGAAQPSGTMLLTAGQYAVLAGLAQLHDSSEDTSQLEISKGGLSGGGDAIVVGNLLLATRPLTSREGQVFVDRLLGRQAYQLALQISDAFGMTPTRVLDCWACAKAQAAARGIVSARQGRSGAGGTAAQQQDTEAAEIRRAAALIRGVFTRFPQASYASCAAVAAAEGSTELALELLRDEPASASKVMMLVQAGRDKEALRTAAESGDADLVYLALVAVLGGGAELATIRTEALAAVLSFPDVACYLVLLAAVRPSWRQAASALFMSSAPPPCRGWFASMLADRRLRDGVGGCGEADTESLCAVLAAPPARGEGPNAGSGRGSADESLQVDEDAVGLPSELPPLFLPKPPLSATGLCFQASEVRSVVAAFARAVALTSKGTDSAPLSLSSVALQQLGAGGSARMAVLMKVWGLDRVFEEERRRAGRRIEMISGAFGSDTVSHSFPVDIRVDLAPFSILSPSSCPPEEVAAAMRRQATLEEEQQQFAQSFQDSRFITAAVSVVDTIGLLAEHGAMAEGDRFRRAFAVSDKKFFLAQFLALCRAEKWEAVKTLLGPPPPLQDTGGSSFFASSSRRGKQRATPPPTGYEVPVEMLLSHNQAEIAAAYVAGITTDPAKRVEWFMNRIGAPIMALEAAYVGGDAGLIAQVLQRVPNHARAQEMGASMMRELNDSD